MTSLDAWKSTTLSSYCRSSLSNEKTQPLVAHQRSLMDSVPPFWSIELTRNGVLEDTFDYSESLFCALPPLDDPNLPPSTQNGGYAAEDRELVRRLLSDADFFLRSERGVKAFTQLVLKQRLCPLSPKHTLDNTKRGGDEEDEGTKDLPRAVRDHVFIGKSDAALIQLENPSVSRIHCVVFLGVTLEVTLNALTQKEERLPVCACFVVDLASSNGTFLVLPKSEATTREQLERLPPGVPTRLADGATIRCGTSSVAITVHCTTWAERFRQREAEQQRKALEAASSSSTFGSAAAVTSNSNNNNSNNNNRIRQRGNDADSVDRGSKNNNDNRDDDLHSSFSTTSFSNSNAQASWQRNLANLRKLSFDALKHRRMQIMIEVATRRKQSQQLEGIGALQNELREIEFVFKEKEQEHLRQQQQQQSVGARGGGGGGHASGSGSITTSVVEIV